MEYRIEYNMHRGKFSPTSAIIVPIVLEPKKAKKIALRVYKCVSRLYKPDEVRLYENEQLIKGRKRK